MNALLYGVHVISIVVEWIATKVGLVIERCALVTPYLGRVEHHLVIRSAIGRDRDVLPIGGLKHQRGDAHTFLLLGLRLLQRVVMNRVARDEERRQRRQDSGEQHRDGELCANAQTRPTWSHLLYPSLRSPGLEV